ncbi:uncharacterized protein LOC111261586 isoform X1 [Varroa jacobsoni]|uniref:uncharacterized protein LOC111261586 isoform X1 n=1 Tax=Varroa jacobsoni TaxID=62625 RepID=UPI000BF8689B|nr:uncharacterized protein LOC111261586 isoform X1 [Varroa jacobsoni]XP_022690924.1 uncharacterized protein LOC111261586 isoform X1 [Varroa jacobsoni]
MQRHFLWKHQATSDRPPVVLGILSKKKPLMRIRERVLNAAYQTYVDNKKALFVVGELLCGSPEAEGLEVEVNAVRGKPQPGPLRSADFLASCRFCRLAEARDPNNTVLDLVEDVKTKQYSLGTGTAVLNSAQTNTLRQLTNFFSLDIHGKLEGPNCSVDVSFVCFERRLNAYKISKLPLAENTIFRMLSQLRKELLWGWVRTSKGSCHLLQKDDARQDVTGVWISGVKTPHHPLVWLVCQHFLSSVQPPSPHARLYAATCGGKSRFQQIQAKDKDIFVLIVFDHEGDLTFYTVIPIDDVMRTVVLSGVEKTTVTRVFSARDRLVDITLDLCFIDDGDFTFDATMMNQSENSNSTRYKQIRTELTAERNLSEGGQMSAIQSTEEDVNTESYRIATRRDAPIWLSPSVGQQYTPATIGLQKQMQPKRVHLTSILPERNQTLDSLEPLGPMPSASSTPLDRVIPSQKNSRLVCERRSSERSLAPDSRYSFENVESNSPRNVSPELLEIIRKQELEISLLKEQLQMLIVNSNSNNVASSSDEGSRTRKSSGDRDNDSNTNSQKLIHGGNSPKEPRQHPTVAVDDIIEPTKPVTSDGYCRPISPPETPPHRFVPMCSYELDTPKTFDKACYPLKHDTDNLMNSAQFHESKSEDKTNEINNLLSKPYNQQLKLLNEQLDNQEKNNADPEENVYENIGNVLQEDYQNDGKQLSAAVQSTGSFVMFRLGEQFKLMSTKQLRHQDVLQDKPASDLALNGDNVCSLVVPPRLQYESLALSGTQPSILVDQVTRKYFGRSPQIPTTTMNSNTVFNKPHILGIGKTSPPIGMLRRVLTAEATKQVVGQNGEVSVITRKYMKMEDIQRVKAKPISDGSSDERYVRNFDERNSERFLDIDALKRQPKLL